MNVADALILPEWTAYQDAQRRAVRVMLDDDATSRQRCAATLQAHDAYRRFTAAVDAQDRKHAA